jgi:hypothetical protein
MPMANPVRIFALTGDAVMRSRDAGMTWIDHMNTLPYRVGEAARLQRDQSQALREPGARRDPDLFDPTGRAILRFTDLLTSRPGNNALNRHWNRRNAPRQRMT